MHRYESGNSVIWPSKAEIAATTGDRLLFMNWKPKGANWRSVANGADDAYLKNIANNIKTKYNKPFYLSINAEMEDEVNATAGSGRRQRTSPRCSITSS